MNVSSSAKRHTCDAVQAKQPEPTTSAAAGTRLRIGREPESRVSMRAPPDPHPPATVEGDSPIMPRLVECVPNFSEGRRRDVVDRILDAIAAVPGVTLLDREMDPDHHRSVLTFAGEPEPVLEAAFRAIATAAQLIDLNH